MPSYAIPPTTDRPAFTEVTSTRPKVDGQRQVVHTGGTVLVRPEKDPTDSTVVVKTVTETKS